MGITALYDVLKVKMDDDTKLAILDDFDRVLGLNLLKKAADFRKTRAESAANTLNGYSVTGEGDTDIDALVLARGIAKRAKDFTEADRIRDELKNKGIEITDIPGGAVWKRG